MVDSGEAAEEAVVDGRTIDIRSAVTLATSCYKSLHENPELGNQESNSHDFIARVMNQLGYTTMITSQRCPTAVIAVLNSERPGRTIALRSELDALPLQEASAHDPRSHIQGVMHACGHDAHCAVLLGVAAVLRSHADLISGRVLFIFQPAEEVKGGADD